MAARSQNLWPFSSRKTAKKAKPAAKRSTMTVGQSMSAAFQAGQKSGDSGMFNRWLETVGLSQHSAFLKSRLRTQYERGVDEPIRAKVGAIARERADELNRQFLEREERAERARKAKPTEFKGRKIEPLSDGSWVVPSIDRESYFDSLKDARAFIQSWSKNPKVTDRALRYRAQKAVKGPKQCVLCGSRGRLDVMHLDGNESHGEAANLAYGCRSCNGKLAAAFKVFGAGRPTNQYNPVAAAIPTFEQYMWAVSNHERGAHDEGGAVIHATPKHKRIEYARQIVHKAQRTKRERAAERWNPDSGSSIPVFPLGTESFSSVPSQADFPSMDEAVAYAEAVKDEHPGVGVLGRIDGATNKPVYAVIFDFSKLRAANPANPSRWFSTATYAQGEVDRLSVSGIKARIVPAKSKQGGFLVVWKTPRRNPESSAASLYESFHGTPATQVLEVEEEVHDHEHLALLGRLVDIWVVTLTGFLVHFEFDEKDPVWCSSSEDGRQLYFVGGDQDIDLESFQMDGKDWIKDRMVIGQFAPPICGKCGTGFTKRGQTFTCPKCGHKATYEDHGPKDVVYNLGYHTKKKFDKMDPIDYQHDLGEETGVRPMLEYDPRSKHLYVTGGQYRIEKPLLDMSPGIEN